MTDTTKQYHLAKHEIDAMFNLIEKQIGAINNIHAKLSKKSKVFIENLHESIKKSLDTINCDLRDVCNTLITLEEQDQETSSKISDEDDIEDKQDALGDSLCYAQTEEKIYITTYNDNVAKFISKFDTKFIIVFGKVKEKPYVKLFFKNAGSTKSNLFYAISNKPAFIMFDPDPNNFPSLKLAEYLEFAINFPSLKPAKILEFGINNANPAKEKPKRFNKNLNDDNDDDDDDDKDGWRT
jgi:hypothetical protein